MLLVRGVFVVAGAGHAPHAKLSVAPHWPGAAKRPSAISTSQSTASIPQTHSSAGRPASTLRGSALRLCDTSAFTQRIARSGGRAPIRQ